MTFQEESPGVLTAELSDDEMKAWGRYHPHDRDNPYRDRTSLMWRIARTAEARGATCVYLYGCDGVELHPTVVSKDTGDGIWIWGRVPRDQDTARDPDLRKKYGLPTQ